MENYEQKYKHAIEKAKKELKTCDSLDCDVARQIFRLFPELQSIKIDNSPNEDLGEAADSYLESIQPVGFMEGDYDGTQILDAFKRGADWQKNRDKQILSTLYDDCSCLKDSLDKVTTGNLSHRIGNIKFSITGMQVLIKQAMEDR